MSARSADSEIDGEAPTMSRSDKKKGSRLRTTPWFMWWAILGSNQ